MKTHRTLTPAALLVVSAVGCATSHDARQRDHVEASAVKSLSVSAPSEIAGTIAEHDSLAPARIQVPGAESVCSTFNGTNYVLAWAEVRGGFLRVMAARVNESGVRLDKTGIVVASEQISPIVSLGDGGYGKGPIRITHANGGSLITWTDTGANVGTIRGARVSDDGAVLDSAPFSIQNRANFSYDVATDGQAFMVLSSARGKANDDDLFATPVNGLSATGADRVGKSFKIGTTQISYFSEPHLVRVGSNYLALWTQRDLPNDNAHSLHAVAFDQDGAAVSAAKTVGTTIFYPRFAASGNRVLVLGRINYVDGTPPVTASALLDPTGTLLGAETLYADAYSDPIAMRGVSDGFVAALSVYDPNTQESIQCLQRYDLSSAKSGACETIGADQNHPALAFSVGAGSVVLSQEYNYGEGNEPLVARLFTRPGSTPIADVRLTHAANAQMLSALAFDGQKYLAVWADDSDADKNVASGGKSAIFATRIDQSGHPETPVQISLPGAGAVSRPAIFFDGEFFVAWRESDQAHSHLAVANISSSTASGTGPITVSSRAKVREATSAPWEAQGWPAIASDGKTRVVAWFESDQYVVASRYSVATHAFTDSVPAILDEGVYSPSRRPVAPAAVYDGTQFLVMWPRYDGIYGTVLDVNAQRLLSTQMLFAGGVSYVEGPSLATDGKTGSLLAWADINVSDDQLDVYAKLIPSVHPEKVNPTANILEMSTGLGEQSYPAVAYANDDVGYMIAWGDFRDPAARRVYANWVSRDGRVLEGSGTLLGTASSNDEEWPALATAGRATVGMVYSRFMRDAGIGNSRAYFRSVVSGKLNGDACANTSECASRYCVEGLCCNAPCDDECATCSSTPGTCAPRTTATTCGPDDAYRCGGTELTCSSTCDADTTCAPGKACINHSCATPQISQTVCADETMLKSPTGDLTSCAPFRCVTNACKERCESVDDCSVGNVCDFGGRCVPSESVENAGASGCAVAQNAKGSAHGGLLGLGLALSLLFRRRRPEV